MAESNDIYGGVGLKRSGIREKEAIGDLTALDGLVHEGGADDVRFTEVIPRSSH